MENNEEKKAVIFTEGIKTIKKVKDTFFYLKINVDEFNTWANKHKKENGCVYINLCISNYGNWYSKLSTYTGKQINDAANTGEELPF